MELIPIGDLIIVERLESKNQTKSGIILPIPNQKSLGKVISVGKGILNKYDGTYLQYNIDIDDIVIFQTHRGHPLKIDNKNLLVLSMKNILCTYKYYDLVDGKMELDIEVEETTGFMKL